MLAGPSAGIAMSMWALWLGADHGALRADLVPKLRCAQCGSRRVGIIITPGTKEYGGNPYEGG